MAQITAGAVKELRERTLAGMADCKKALEETAGDMEKAAEWLRKKGITKAGSAATQGRVASEGAVTAYVHMGGKLAVLIHAEAPNADAAKSKDFVTFVDNCAMQIAAMSPLVVDKSKVDAVLRRVVAEDAGLLQRLKDA